MAFSIGFTSPVLKRKWLAFGESAAFGELLHEPPQAPAGPTSAPESLLRYPDAGTDSNRLLNDVGNPKGARTVSWFSNTDEPPDAACRKAASESHSSEGYWIYKTLSRRSLTSRNSDPDCLIKKLVFSKQAMQILDAAHRKAVRPVIVVQRVHVAGIEIQVARVRRIRRVRRTAP